ncbi:MAG: HAMP domain-containing protein [Chloroflexi bacterium]|nr:HAMP domain-containing protein [Chloroflexota bacterium]
MNFIHSIKFRFTLWYLVVLGILLVLLSTGVYFGLSHGLHNSLDDSLKLRALQLSNSKVGLLESISEGGFQEKLGEVVSLYFVSEDELIPIPARGVDVPTVDQMVMEAIEGNKSFATMNTSEGEELRLYAIPFTAKKPGLIPVRPRISSQLPSGALVVGRSTEDIDDALHGLRQILIISNLVTLAVAGAGGIFLARRALKPVDDIAQTTLEIEKSGDLSQRIPVNTKDELGRLATALNQMIERLEKAFKRQQQFTGDASHELRTPLAIIEAESTLALEKDRSAEEYRQSLETVTQEAENMSNIIDQLLALARADAGKEQLTFEEIQLDELLRDVASDADVLCREKGLKFEFGSIEDVTVRGDNSGLRQLFLNLLNNSIRYTPSGGSITISLAKEGNQAIASLTDTGIGIPEDEIPNVFERFYRVDKARSRADGGSGLGLAICKHIAEVHGGSVEVESRQGEGSTFSVRLPIA